MTQFAERFTRISDGFDRRVQAVPDGAWDNPSPCEGWVARDIVRHLVEWVPSFFTSTAGLTFPSISSVDDEPVAAWVALRSAVEEFLSDAETAEQEFNAPMGRMTVEEAIDMIVTGDVFLHTWDLARSVGLDESLDTDEVKRMFDGMEPMDAMLRGSGQYGPRIDVPEDADLQTKLIAFVGRDPY